MSTPQGKLIILTGPSACGKDAISSLLLEKLENSQKIITTTSRHPREGENNGKHYHFVTKESFQKLINHNKLFEYVEYAGNFYGTPKDAFLPLKSGTNLIWITDMSMASRAKTILSQLLDLDISESILIFLILADWYEIIGRLKLRGWDKNKIEQRLKQDKSDLNIYSKLIPTKIWNHDNQLGLAFSEIWTKFHGR